eukprot:gene11626-317_t
MYLAVANFHDGSGVFTIASELFRWDGSQFVTHQKFLTKGAMDLEYFSPRPGDHYLVLVVANHYDDAAFSYSCDSDVFKWEDASAMLIQHQTVPTHGAAGIDHYQIGTDNYIVFANQQTDSTNVINSDIYKWDAASTLLQIEQQIVTRGAHGWRAFTVPSTGASYLAVANHNDGSQTLLDSELY